MDTDIGYSEIQNEHHNDSDSESEMEGMKDEELNEMVKNGFGDTDDSQYDFEGSKIEELTQPHYKLQKLNMVTPAFSKITSTPRYPDQVYPFSNEQSAIPAQIPFTDKPTHKVNLAINLPTGQEYYNNYNHIGTRHQIEEQFDAGQYQTQVLLEGKQNEINKLNNKIAFLQTNHQKDLRFLQHKLNVAEGTYTGLEISLKQSNELVVQNEDKIKDFLIKIETLETNAKVEKEAKQELAKKLNLTETSRRILEDELSNVKKNANSAQLREHYESILETQKQKHSKDLLILQTKFDKLAQNFSLLVSFY